MYNTYLAAITQTQTQIPRQNSFFNIGLGGAYIPEAKWKGGKDIYEYIHM